MAYTSRRALLAAAATLGALPVASAHGRNSLTVEVTGLGTALIDALPPFCSARFDCGNTCSLPSSPRYDAAVLDAVRARQEAAYGQVEQAVAEIRQAAKRKPLDHLGDLALLIRYRTKDEYDTEDEDREDIFLLTNTLLAIAGVSRELVDEDLICDRVNAGKSA